MFKHTIVLICIRYDSLTMHFLLVSFISCCHSHSCSGYQTSLSIKVPGCPHGVLSHHGVCLPSARRGGTQGPPPAGHVELGPAARRRSVAQLAKRARL